MTSSNRDDRLPSERIHDIDRMLEEMSRGIREALLEHKRAGNPVVVWRNGRVEWIQPEDIPVEDPRDLSPRSPEPS